MSRKLCGVLVVVAVLGSVAVFAWPGASAPTDVGLVPASQPPLSRPQAVQPMSPRQEQQRLRAQRAVAHYTRRMEHLVKALEAARKEGRTSDIAALEKALDRQRTRIERLNAAAQTLGSRPAAPAAAAGSTGYGR